jgi:hypothetical protein
MSEETPVDEHVFTVRLWRERSASGPSDQEWRGRLRHAQSRSARHFVGLGMLFDLIRELVAGSGRGAPH